MSTQITKQDLDDLRIDPTKPAKIVQVIDSYYTRDEWLTGNYIYSILQNGFGHYWPNMHTVKDGKPHYPIIIRNSDPFKKLGSAIKFIEKHIAEVAKRQAQKQ